MRVGELQDQLEIIENKRLKISFVLWREGIKAILPIDSVYIYESENGTDKQIMLRSNEDF